MHYTDCCLSARQTATRAKTIRLQPKTNCHGLLFSNPCIGPWQTCLGATMILQGHPSMRNSLPPPGDSLALHFQAVWPSIDQRWSSCRCHSHSLHCCHHPSPSRRIHNSPARNCAGRLPRGISACLVTWLIDGLFVYTRRDALLERDRRHWRICMITGASTTLPKNFAGGISTVFNPV